MTKSIFIIEDLSDFNEITKKINLVQDAKVFSLNYSTHKILTKHKIEHNIGEDYLTDEDKNNIDTDSINATINWSNNKKISSYLSFDDINLSNLIELELSQYFMPFYRSATTIMRIIEKEKPDSIIISSHLNDFVERICKTKKIQVNLIRKIEQPSLQYDQINIKFNLGNIPISLTISRKTYLKIKRTTDKVIHSVFRLKPDLNVRKEKSILLLDFNPVQYDVLIKELSLLDKNIILLNQRRPAIWNLSSLKIMTNSRCKILDLNIFEKKIKTDIENKSNTFFQSLEELWKQDSIFEEIFSLDSQTLWYSIKNSLTQICNSRFRESIQRIMLLKEMFNEFNISVILEWAELGQEEKEILTLSKKIGIKSIMLQHAMFPTSKYWDKYARFVLFFTYPLLSDKQAIWGEITKRHILSYDYCKDLVITGSPKHDIFFNTRTNQKSNGTILFATTQISGIHAENSTTDKFLKFDNFVKEVCRVAKLFPNKKLIVKPHPAPNFINNITELIKEIDPNIIISHSTNVKDLISHCDLLITFNNSTIALDSIILDKPTMVLQIEKWAEESEIVKMGAILPITEISEIENGVRKLLLDEEFQNNLIINGRKFVQTYLSNRGTASKSLANILDTY